MTRSFDPTRDYHWPIPFTEIDLNPTLEQNPN
ncbi:RagB/SusD family nutrient uptake outer membrane protein [Algoriphagus aestuariicola]|uniref:RagB/SusD family nutrient uptake outer membrane protein n=1 Tax=Algoriphagus aestuariicola TaxID=1852016 RepID=A0ABS3BMM6_9BACT|nr:RagB/SusD family nutrient uptake outer membrane protein [Algoriphagus aestuariicola]MBN7800089.1 RagB/SusD family nutrient uptake outer membrane protein [Algoriphagus aestuariicola]